MTLNPPPRFVNLPAGILFDPQLPDALFRTLAQLHGLAWQTKGERTPPATVAEFARLRGLKTRRMYDHLRELKAKGYIRVENLGHNRIVIFPLRWDKGAALPADDDTSLSADDLAALTDDTLPLRWEPDAALSPSVPDVTGTATNSGNPSDPPDFTAKLCSNTATNCSSSRRCCFKDSESDSKKQQRQLQTTDFTAKNCSKIPPDFQPLLELLVDRCGSPAKIARDAVCASARRDDDPDFVRYDALRWLAYCRSDRGKTINAPGIFIARKIERAEPCPDYFQTDYGSPLHAEIRALARQLE